MKYFWNILTFLSSIWAPPDVISISRKKINTYCNISQIHQWQGLFSFSYPHICILAEILYFLPVLFMNTKKTAVLLPWQPFCIPGHKLNIIPPSFPPKAAPPTTHTYVVSMSFCWWQLLLYFSPPLKAINSTHAFTPVRPPQQCASRKPQLFTVLVHN